jgi:hypothetical protein
MSVVVLHLSDLHFGSDKGSNPGADDRTLILQSLINCIKDQPEKWKPKVISISGDIGFAGQGSDYESAGRWLRKLLDAVALDPSNVILCPGNHDVDYSKKGYVYPPNAEEADDCLQFPVPPHLQSRFDEYNKFCHELGILPVVNKGEQNYLCGSRTLFGIRFVVLNSAWFCKDSKKDRGNLWLGLLLIKGLEADGIIKECASGDAPCVTLIHHPPAWLNPSEREPHSTALRACTVDYLSKRCNIILTGHTHGSARDPDKIAAAAWHVTSGAAYENGGCFNNFALLRIEANGFTMRQFEFDPRAATQPWNLKGKVKPRQFYDNALKQEQKNDTAKLTGASSREEPLSNLTALVDTSRLPKPTIRLIGRNTELKKLTTALIKPNISLAIIEAAGGIGKSALIDEWLQSIALNNYYGKTRVFGWSFYSQGLHSTYTNSQEFFSKVLEFLGVDNIPDAGYEKARLLARCMQQQPCLLILDGLEPLQFAEDLQGVNGELRDKVLKEFIDHFRRRTTGNSFILISSRQPLMELINWHKEHYLRLPLETLRDTKGGELLDILGVKGNKNELRAISNDLNGHALSLVLMGRLLRKYHEGDCRYAKALPPLESVYSDEEDNKESRQVIRVLKYYDCLQDATSRCFLQIIGLFDRPMSWEEKNVLIDKAQHAKPLRVLTAKQWQEVNKKLEESGLLLGIKGDSERIEWDTHPIIRSYFGRMFKEKHREAFKQAHRVLFDYYQQIPDKEYPDTIEEMRPLYRAVAHGCLAGEYRKALFDVFNKRVQRGQQYYSSYKLAAYSEDITALSAYSIGIGHQFRCKSAANSAFSRTAFPGCPATCKISR